MVFSIDQIYKESTPRKEFYRSPVNTLTSGDTSGMTVSPTTTPENWAYLISKMKVYDSSFITSGTGSGVLQMEYPDYPGVNVNTYTFDSLLELKMQADELVDDGTNIFYQIVFKPAILLRASYTESDLVLSLPNDVAITSGELKTLFTGWKLKEEDYD